MWKRLNVTKMYKCYDYNPHHLHLHLNNSKNKLCFQHGITIGILLPKNRYKPSKQR